MSWGNNLGILSDLLTIHSILIIYVYTMLSLLAPFVLIYSYSGGILCMSFDAMFLYLGSFQSIGKGSDITKGIFTQTSQM